MFHRVTPLCRQAVVHLRSPLYVNVCRSTPCATEESSDRAATSVVSPPDTGPSLAPSYDLLRGVIIGVQGFLEEQDINLNLGSYEKVLTIYGVSLRARPAGVVLQLSVRRDCPSATNVACKPCYLKA